MDISNDTDTGQGPKQYNITGSFIAIVDRGVHIDGLCHDTRLFDYMNSVATISPSTETLTHNRIVEWVDLLCTSTWDYLSSSGSSTILTSPRSISL